MADEPQLLRGRVVTRDAVLPDGYVEVRGSRLSAVGPAKAYAGRQELPRPRGTLLPGLVDIHCHGGGGATVTSGDPAQVESVARHHQAAGSTTLIASTVTDSAERMLAMVRAGAAMVERGLLAGLHLEGPFLAPARRGAHDPRHLRLPDLGLTRQLVEAGGGHVRVMTLAPELPRASQLMDLLDELGVQPAVGHTEGEAAVVAQALGRDRPGLVTHLFNGMPPLHHREPGPVAGSLSAAARGEARVELVADGVHLGDATVRMVFDLLGPERIVLVTDAMAAAGMPDGVYDLGSQRVEVRNRVARLAGVGEQSIAGGTSRLLEVVSRCVHHAGIDLAAAVAAASSTPAAVLGLEQELGALAAGLRADLIVVDDDLALQGVMRGGRWVR